MSEELFNDPFCAVCGRRLLHGERPTSYRTSAGAEVVVCELCKPRAEAAGWILPGEANARRAGAPGRERRRSRSQVLGGLLARLPAAGSGEPESDGEPAVATPARSRRRPPSDPSAPARPAEGPKPPPPAPATESTGPGVTLPQALAAFNGSNHRRTVAGLTRTLGPPRASGLAVRASSGYPGVRLTVAWELTWYQWEIGPGPRGAEVRESGKGETLDQLRAADRTWNLAVGNDGTLGKQAATVAGEGQGARE